MRTRPQYPIAKVRKFPTLEEFKAKLREERERAAILREIEKEDKKEVADKFGL